MFEGAQNVGVERTYESLLKIYVTSQDGFKFIISVDRNATQSDLEYLIAETYDNLVNNRQFSLAPTEVQFSNYKVKRLRQRGYVFNIPTNHTISLILRDKDEIECEIQANKHTMEPKMEEIRASPKPKAKEKKDDVQEPAPKKKVRIEQIQKETSFNKQQVEEEEEINFDEPVVIQATEATLFDSSLEAHALNIKQKMLNGKTEQQQPAPVVSQPLKQQPIVPPKQQQQQKTVQQESPQQQQREAGLIRQQQQETQKPPAKKAPTAGKPEKKTDEDVNLFFTVYNKGLTNAQVLQKPPTNTITKAFQRAMPPKIPEAEQSPQGSVQVAKQVTTKPVQKKPQKAQKVLNEVQLQITIEEEVHMSSSDEAPQKAKKKNQRKKEQKEQMKYELNLFEEGSLIEEADLV